MIEIFGPNTLRVVRFIAQVAELSAEEIDTAAAAWGYVSAEERAAAWSAIRHTTGIEGREAIRNAVVVARHQARATAVARDRCDWAFWSAAADAAGALAADWPVTDRWSYRVLVSPMATTLDWLLTQAPSATPAPRHEPRLDAKSAG